MPTKTSSNSLPGKYMAIKPMFRFIANAGLLVIAWAIFYGFFRHAGAVHQFYEWGTQWLTNNFLVVSKGFLQLLELETIIEGKVLRAADGVGGVLLDRGCLGRNVMGLFAGFLMAYPGSIKSKLWYIPCGLGVIYLLNILRISFLLLAVRHFPESYADYDHHAIFNYVVYSCIVLMWLFWMRKFGSS